jgi:hypothetical protein
MSTLSFQGGVIFRTFAPDSGFRTYAMLTAMVYISHICHDRKQTHIQVLDYIFTSPPLLQETSSAKESSQDDCVAKFELWLSSEDIILKKPSQE